MKLRLLLIILFFLTSALRAGAQADTAPVRDSLSDHVYVLRKVDREGESLPEIEIKEVTVRARPPRQERAARRKFDRLEYNIRRVYPYALIVRYKLEEVNSELIALTDENEKKKYLKNVEKDVFGEYEDDLMDMTITQGRLLIKLIDRETQNTSYTLIRQYRGGLSAAFWQGIARIFGTNLKDEYDPYGEDALIEMIVNDLEDGRL